MESINPSHNVGIQTTTEEAFIKKQKKRLMELEEDWFLAQYPQIGKK